jgi:hypothetical protein
MFSLPLITFFLFNNFKLNGYLYKLDLDTRLAWSGIASVVIVQIIIAWYIITSLKESK